MLDRRTVLLSSAALAALTACGGSGEERSATDGGELCSLLALGVTPAVGALSPEQLLRVVTQALLWTSLPGPPGQVTAEAVRHRGSAVLLPGPDVVRPTAPAATAGARDVVRVGRAGPRPARV